MSLVALQDQSWKSRRMVDTTDRDRMDRERAGAALKTLRKRAGLTQEEAAHAAGVSVQSWGNYETGRRFMDNPTLIKVVRGVNASVEEHQLEVARLTPLTEPRGGFGAGMAERERSMAFPVGGVAHGGALRPNVFDDGGDAEIIDFGQFFTNGTRVLRQDGMSMWPYAEPGGFITYNIRKPPKRGDGCVIEMKDGSYVLKRFERYDGESLIVSEIWPRERELDPIPTEEIKGVYAVGLRGG